MQSTPKYSGPILHSAKVEGLYYEPTMNLIRGVLKEPNGHFGPSVWTRSGKHKNPNYDLPETIIKIILPQTA